MPDIYKICAGLLLMICSHSAIAQNDVVNDAKASAFDKNKPEREEWLKNSDAGLFIHFGVDAQLGIVISHSLVGASNDYVEHFFKDLPKTFDPSKFDPKAIATLAKMAGMKYICFTTKHHSGFCMWDTKTTDFKITKTPYKKDLLKEYVDATRAAGLGVGFYFSPEDFNFLHNHNIPISRNVVMDDKMLKEYNDYNRRQCEELMKNYGKIDVLFIDGEPKEIVKETCWKIQPDILITRGAINTPEQQLPGTKSNAPWLSAITMGTAWQYQPTNERYKSGNNLIKLLIEARAKGGSLLLNVGPKANGALADEQEDRLREMAAWYFLNHESVDSTRSWVVSKEDNVWFTSKGDNTVYAIVTDVSDWKEGQRKEFTFHSVKSTANTKVSVLGQNSQVIEYKPTADVATKFQQTAEGLKVSAVKAQRIYDDHTWPNPVVIKLENIAPTIAEAVVVQTGFGRPGADGMTVRGTVLNYQNKNVKRARIDYRTYAGQVETLYAGKWVHSEWVNIEANGSFTIVLKDLKAGDYEYRAVAEQDGIEIEGENRVMRKP